MQIGFITILNLSTHMKIDELRKIAKQDPYYHGIGCIRLPIGIASCIVFIQRNLLNQFQTIFIVINTICIVKVYMENIKIQSMILQSQMTTLNIVCRK